MVYSSLLEYSSQVPGDLAEDELLESELSTVKSSSFLVNVLSLNSDGVTENRKLFTREDPSS